MLKKPLHRRLRGVTFKIIFHHRCILKYTSVLSIKHNETGERFALCSLCHSFIWHHHSPDITRHAKLANAYTVTYISIVGVRLKFYHWKLSGTTSLKIVRYMTGTLITEVWQVFLRNSLAEIDFSTTVLPVLAWPPSLFFFQQLKFLLRRLTFSMKTVSAHRIIKNLILLAALIHWPTVARQLSSSQSNAHCSKCFSRQSQISEPIISKQKPLFMRLMKLWLT